MINLLNIPISSLLQTDNHPVKYRSKFTVSSMEFSKQILGNFVLVLLLFAGVLYICVWSPARSNPLLPYQKPRHFCPQTTFKTTKLPVDELELALEKAALPDKTVIIVIVNRAYVEQSTKADTTMLDLFLDSIWLGEGTRPLLNHLLVVAVDQTAYDRCMFKRLHCYRLVTEGVDFTAEKVYMSQEFIKMMWRRTLFLLDVLQRGYNFIFTAHERISTTIFSDDRGEAVAMMCKALANFLKIALKNNVVARVIGLGGTGSTSLMLIAFTTLPIRIPKVVVSTVDNDVMWLRDPFRRLNKNGIEDLQISVDEFNGDSRSEKNLINTGFYFIRSNNKTIQLFSTWYGMKDKSTGKKEQDVLLDLMRHGIFRKLGLQVRFLDTKYFSGFCQDSKDIWSVTTVHANCCRHIEAKVSDLKAVHRDWKRYKAMKTKYPSIAWNQTLTYGWSKHIECINSWKTEKSNSS